MTDRRDEGCQDKETRSGGVRGDAMGSGMTGSHGELAGAAGEVKIN